MCASHSCLAAPDIPEWVHELAMPVWVTTSDGTISYLNPRAETLIGHSAAACAGHPCHLVISGRTLEGAPLCLPRCRVRRLASRHEEIAPIPMKVAAAGGGQREVTVLVIHATDHQLVHCVVDAVTHARLREFIDHVARRAMHDTMRRRMHNDILTPREREILLLLEQGVTQKEIAARLVVSYTTVRNHVQHILGKLGVHSIMEAIAVALTEDE